MGIFSSLFGGSNKSTSTSSTEPWSVQQPFYKQIFGDAQNLYNQGKLSPNSYPGSQVAPQSQATLMARQGILDRAGVGSTLNDNAYNLTSDTLGGKYLDITQNPSWQQGLDDISKAFARGTAAQTDSAAARSGGYGGSAYNELVGINNRALGNALTDYAGNLYNQERNRQTQALGLAPSIDQLGYSDLNRIAGVGSQDEAYQQKLINDAVNKYSAPAQNLEAFKSIIGAPLGQTTTNTQTYNNNPLGNILGLTGLAASQFNNNGLFSDLFGGGNSYASNYSGLSDIGTPWKYASIEGLPWLNA